MCCSPARRGATVSDYLTSRPLQTVLGPVLSLQRRKRRMKGRLKPKPEKKHSIYKGAKRKRKARRDEGQKDSSWHPCEICSGQ